MYFEKRYRVSVWTVSGFVGLSVMLTPLLYRLYTPQGPYLIPLSQKVNNSMALGLIIALVFPSVVEYSNHRWRRQVERNIPRLLRDITEAVQTGLPLPRALEEASQRDYGPLSQELEHALSLFILGASWEDSLMSLAKRLRIPSALRLSTILVEAHQTGGKTIEVLNASVDLFSSLEEYREEQYSNMRPYIFTIYMATTIFLIITFAVLHQFLYPLYNATANTTVMESGLLSGVLDIEYYTSILFWASIVESIFGGLIAGKIGEKNLSAGLRHSIVLCLATLLFFNI